MILAKENQDIIFFDHIAHPYLNVFQMVYKKLKLSAEYVGFMDNCTCNQKESKCKYFKTRQKVLLPPQLQMNPAAVLHVLPSLIPTCVIDLHSFNVLQSLTATVKAT